MKFNPLAKPSVESAVSNLESALAALKAARDAHETKAADKFEQGNRLLEESDAEAAKAIRAQRIHDKLTDLLA